MYVRENYSGGRLKRPKSGKVRSAPMSDHVVVALDTLSKREHWSAPDDLVFPSPTRGHLDDMAVRPAFYKALEAAKLPRVRLHDLRTPSGHRRLRSSPPWPCRRTWGTRTSLTTERYLHYVPAVEDAAKLTEVFGGESATPAKSSTATPTTGGAYRRR